MTRRPAVKVSRESVFAACEQIFLEGAAPTGAAVQAALGGGSPNGIYRFVNEWYADLRLRFEQLRDAAERPRPPEIPPALWDALLPLWDRLNEAALTAANAALEPERRQLADAMADARQAREVAENDCLTRARERDGLVEQRDQVAAALEDAKARMARLEGQHRADAAALAEARDTIAALNQQAVREREAFTEQLSAIRAEHAEQLKARDTAADRDSARLMKSWDAERQELRARTKDLEQRLRSAETKLQGKETEALQLHQRLGSLQAQVEGLQTRLATEAARQTLPPPPMPKRRVRAKPAPSARPRRER